ncbi:MAG TPA: GNAT family protein [Solirubrobacteraceae bacterium]
MLSAEHIALRAIEREDLPQLLAWRNEPTLRRFFRERRELSMEDQTAWFERTIAGPGSATTRMFAIAQRRGGELVGACGLCYIDWVDATAELSLYIGRDRAYVDELLAPDAARLLIRHAFAELDLRRLWVEVYAYDTLKAELLRALGFALEGTLREHRFHAGARHDSLFFGLLRSEWRA